MSASVRRHVCTYSLVGALLVGSASPAIASGRGDDPQAVKPTFDIALASATPYVPGISAPVFDTATTPAPAQPSLTVQRDGTAGFAAPSVRRSLIVSFAALQVLDAHSTMKALSGGGREANPAMAGIASNRGALLAVKAGTSAATAYFAERLSRNHPRGAIVLMAVLNGAYAAVVAHNYRVARRQ